MTSTPARLELHAGCWQYNYDYVGPLLADDYNDFSICANFDFGSERFFSGLRIIIVCKNDREELKDLAVSEYSDTTDDEGSIASDRDSGTSSTSSDDSSNRQECVAFESQESRKSGLPLCTVACEITDNSDCNWSANTIRSCSAQTVDDGTYRILYEHVEPTSSTTSLFLFLNANKSFRGILRRTTSGMACNLRVRTGITARGVRILPPPPHQPQFANPPPEILRLIFAASMEDKMYAPWRTTLISFGSVCRAWAPAISMIYEDFSVGHSGTPPPNPLLLAKTLRLNPAYGRAIQQFAPFHFPYRKEELYQQRAESIVTILETAIRVKDLTITNILTDLKDKFVRALYACTEVQDFQLRPMPQDRPSIYSLTFPDIVQCVAHWPRLHSLAAYGVGSSNLNSAQLVEEERTPGLAPSCEMQKLHLQGGDACDSDLLRLVSSSFSSLTALTLVNVTGLTNTGVNTLLAAIAPNIISLSFNKCSFSRKDPGEERAIDATISQMHNIQELSLYGDMFSELVFARYEKDPLKSRHGTIKLFETPVGTITSHFLTVLRYTNWKRIQLFHGLDDPELRGRAFAAAEEEGIELMVWHRGLDDWSESSSGAKKACRYATLYAWPSTFEVNSVLELLELNVTIPENIEHSGRLRIQRAVCRFLKATSQLSIDLPASAIRNHIRMPTSRSSASTRRILGYVSRQPSAMTCSVESMSSILRRKYCYPVKDTLRHFSTLCSTLYTSRMEPTGTGTTALELSTSVLSPWKSRQFRHVQNVHFDWKTFHRDSKSAGPHITLDPVRYWRQFPRSPHYNPFHAFPSLRIRKTLRTPESEYPRSRHSVWVDASPKWGVGIIIGHRWATWRFATLNGTTPFGSNSHLLELLAIELAVYHLVYDLDVRYMDVAIRGDDVGALSSLIKGLSSDEMQMAAIRRVQECLDSAHLTLRFLYVTSDENLADPLSRGNEGPELYRLGSKLSLPEPVRSYFAKSHA
ncbi:hypothetical protein EVG20_g6808 [Dentipellis fragilis]|uniref:Uncharacterized protein n=1 Tax=Dentipellis fragilis TaxID=205917 RepID=A0A4Y9YHX0_9AGAM|nr:hypothetical protein EVG20_g6808 [Dentipellis fragilis]